MNQAARFNFGFASNMVLLLWCVCGGLLLHMLEANYLTILLAPNYEKAIDTPQDVVDRGLTVIVPPGSEQHLDELENYYAKIDRDIAEMTIVPKVIFGSFEIILILSFLKRIGLNLISGLKIKF